VKAKMIRDGREPNQILHQPPHVGSKTTVSFREGTGHNSRRGEWKGEWREGGGTCEMGSQHRTQTHVKGTSEVPSQFKSKFSRKSS
jgi:hypothetical protein